MFKHISILLLICIFSIPLYSQTIRGSIVSNIDRSPIANATIQLKINHKIAITDSGGYFTIPSPADTDTLLVTYIGYLPKHIFVSKRTTQLLTIELERNSNELLGVTVVNTGYQTLPKERATGSFEKIDTTLFNRAVSADVLSRLEGIASSTFFSKTTGSTDLFIRGISTTNNNNTGPLIILDNFPYEGSLTNINPNDVLDITILKDAAAASIWGAKAGNGVIVITTKKGSYNNPFKLSFNSNLSIQQKPNYFKSRNYISSPDFIAVEQMLFNKGFYNPYISNTYYGVTLSPVVEILARQKAGYISATEAEAQLTELGTYDVRNDYEKYLNATALKQQYSLSLNGGNAMINYRISAGLDQAPSTTIGNRQQRITVASMTQIRPLRSLELTVGLNYSNSKSYFNGFPEVPAGMDKPVVYPYTRLADASGQALSIARNIRAAYIDTAGRGLLADWHYKPLEEINIADNTYASNDYLFKLSASYQILPGLKIEGSGQYEQAFSDLRNYYSTNTYYARNLINLYSAINNGLLTKNIPHGGIADNTNTRLTAYALRGQISYSKQFSINHQVSLIAGAENREVKTNTFQNRVYGFNDQLLTVIPVDYKTNFNWYGNLGSGKIQDNTNYGSLTNRFISLYSNAAYTIADKYVISASMRKDASNLLGVNTNQKWNPFWSAGIGWALSKESFYRVSWIPYLKLRATYGFSGNIDNSLSALPTIMYANTANVLNLPYASIKSIPNPDLHWEKTGMFNIGIDFGLFNNRLNGSIEYYNKSAKDLLSYTPIDPTIGGGIVMMKNTASLVGNGIDIKLNATIIDAKLKWQSQILFSYVTNKVTRSFNEYASKGPYAGFGYTITPLTGKDPYALISFKWNGLDPQNGDPIGLINGSSSKDYAKLVTPRSFDDMVINGTTRPPYFGSWLQTFSYKGFSLSFNVNYKLGYCFRRSTINYSSLFYNWTMNSDYNFRWVKTGDELHTSIPSMTYPSNSYRDDFYGLSEATIEKGDVIRLQDAIVECRFQRIKLGGCYFSNPRFYSYITNLPILWRANHKGIDPDYGTSMAPGVSVSIGFKVDL